MNVLVISIFLFLLAGLFSGIPPPSVTNRSYVLVLGLRRIVHPGLEVPVSALQMAPIYAARAVKFHSLLFHASHAA